MPLENHPKILFRSPHLNFLWFELNDKTFIFFLFIVCLFVCAIDTGVNEGEPIEEFAEQYRESEPEEPYREQELPEGFEDGKFNPALWCMFCPSFYKHNPLTCFTKLHMLLLLKHGWIAIPWFVIIIPWPPRLTSIYDLFFMDVNRC